LQPAAPWPSAMALPMPRDAPVTTHTPVSTAGGGGEGWPPEKDKSQKKGGAAQSGWRPLPGPQSELTLQGLGRGSAGRPAAALAGAVEEAHKGARGLHVPCTHSGTKRGPVRRALPGCCTYCCNQVPHSPTERVDCSVLATRAPESCIVAAIGRQRGTLRVLLFQLWYGTSVLRFWTRDGYSFTHRYSFSPSFSRHQEGVRDRTGLGLPVPKQANVSFRVRPISPEKKIARINVSHRLAIKKRRIKNGPSPKPLC